MKICFTTSLFGSSRGTNPSYFERVKGADYFLFSDRHKSEFNTSWDVIDCSDFPAITNLSSDVRKSRYPKFNGFKILDSLEKSYDVIYYCDAYLNPRADKDWNSITNKIPKEGFALSQAVHPRPDVRKGGAAMEMERIVLMKKDSNEKIQKTISFFKRNYPKVDLSMPQHYFENKIFGYRPNDVVKNFLTKFWEIYSTADITHRDQPLWNVLLINKNYTPAIIRKPKALWSHSGEYGKKRYL